MGIWVHGHWAHGHGYTGIEHMRNGYEEIVYLHSSETNFLVPNIEVGILMFAIQNPHFGREI